MRALWIAVRRHLLVIAIVAGAGGAFGYKYGPIVTPLYTARSVMWVNIPGAESSTGTVKLNQITNNTLSLTIPSLRFTTILVADAHLNRSPFQELGAVTALPELANLLVDIRVVDTDPTVAVQVASAVPQALKDEVADIGGLVPLIVEVQKPIVSAPSQGHPRRKNAIAGGLFGLLLGGLAALFIEYLDLTVRSAPDAERRLGLPVLGTTRRGRVAEVQVRLPRDREGAKVPVEAPAG
jgi:capsular polysaccharide biosynthesis protein